MIGALSVVLLFQIKCNMVARDGSIGESQFDVLHHQHLAGEGKSDARAGRFGGEERNENLSSHIGRNRFAVIAEQQDRTLVLAYADIDVGSMGFDGILDEIDEYLAQHVAVGF